MDLNNEDGMNKEDKEDSLSTNGVGKSSFNEEEGEYTMVASTLRKFLARKMVLIGYPCDLSFFLYAHRDCVLRWCNEKGDIICEIYHEVIQDGSQVLVNSSLQLRATVNDIENGVVEEVEPSHHLADSVQLRIEEHCIEDHESNSKLDKGKCPMEGNERSLTSLKDGVFYIENERPSKGPTGNLNDKTMLLSDLYHFDAYTDMEIDIIAKCYAREDNDLSFSRSRGLGCAFVPSLLPEWVAQLAWNCYGVDCFGAVFSGVFAKEVRVDWKSLELSYFWALLLCRLRMLIGNFVLLIGGDNRLLAISGGFLIFRRLSSRRKKRRRKILSDGVFWRQKNPAVCRRSKTAGKLAVAKFRGEISRRKTAGKPPEILSRQKPPERRRKAAGNLTAGKPPENSAGNK
ncbi:hypothetical protein MA16_Dca019063 [Dendrobium catenatum]|uniref:Uncharacterized protein n=1 Tax=Dendrobium catenatum TaxID=906689 RepID=A0A2I0W2A3_9ASPA|nr:hypothetical protein MA16_Dca019063 [Dendrobium catenatum]